MKQSDDGYAPSHNLQVSTDSAFGVILAQGISQHPDDCKELTPALHRIEENAGKAPVQIVADGGYTTRENILAMDERRTSSALLRGGPKNGGPTMSSITRSLPTIRTAIPIPVRKERYSGTRRNAGWRVRRTTCTEPVLSTAVLALPRRTAAPGRRAASSQGPLPSGGHGLSGKDEDRKGKGDLQDAGADC